MSSACSDGGETKPADTKAVDITATDTAEAAAADAASTTNTAEPVAAAVTDTSAGAQIVDAAASGMSPGKSKTVICSACHGQAGISPNDIWPNLAGQKRGYLIKQIKAFRDGDRDDPSMAPMVNSLSDQDIDDIATYFSELPWSS
jgi:cytochrome c553